MDNTAGTPPDDIFALYSRYDLDIANYKVFDPQTPAFPSPTASDHTAEAEQALASALTAANIESKTVSRQIPAPAQQAVPTPVPVSPPKPARAEQQQPFREFALVSRTARPVESRPKSKSGEFCIQIFGSAGGVGVTTVTATLARFLGNHGQHCGVYGGSKPSILPLFFGSRVGHSPVRFAGLRALYQPSVQLLPPASLPGPAEMATLNKSELLQSAAVKCGYPVNGLLIDNGSDLSAVAPGLRIYVATPDVSSVFGIQRLLASYQHPDTSVICILNRFEPDNILHAEIRSWFAEHFSTLITINDSRLVPEALAEGCTILDWYPQASVALDFERVGEAVLALSDTTTQTQYRHEEAALCS